MSPTPPLQVIALISGGKDSFFSLLHCLANNHRVVALANLYPSPPSSPSPNAQECQDGPSDLNSSDLNSYMYQTVGHTLIPLYATALGIPLYRQQIAGTAVDSQKDYSAPAMTPTEAYSPNADSYDETESLLPLLRRVLADHPHANALSAGAILSTYQRTRIESIALRLGLIPLAYLWQYPYLPTPLPSSAGLLRDMAAVGLDARIVKVASGGLDDGFLWENVCDERVIRRMEKAVGRFGGSVLGEGGEYETVVVRGPMGVWKGRLVVRDGHKVIRNGEGGESWLEFTEEGTVTMVAESEVDPDEWKQRIKTPGLWDARFESLVEELGTMSWDESEAGANDPDAEQLISAEESSNQEVPQPPHRPPDPAKPPQPWCLPVLTTITPSLNFFSNLTAPAFSPLTTQIAHSLDILRALLRTHDLTPASLLSTTILLRSMASFPVLNTMYAALFPHPHPPARATLACGAALPPGVNIMLSAVAIVPTTADQRQGLHVQSRSYWAPANIGPYSQAISVRAHDAGATRLVYVAGQIPLVPATMEVLGADGRSGAGMALFAQQAALALQHQWRIGAEMRVGWWAGAVAFVAGAPDAAQKARAAWWCWRRMHEPPPAGEPEPDDEDGLADGLDAWDRKYGGQGSFATAPAPAPALPDFASATAADDGGDEALVPGFFAVQVAALPRGCAIEWQSMGLADATVAYGSSALRDSARSRVCTVTSAEGVAVEHVGFPLATCSEAYVLEQCVQRVNHRRAAGEDGGRWRDFHATLYTASVGAFCGIEAQLVPCERVWGAGGVELRVGLVVQWVR
ncbi:hypothetical protein MMC27_005353 [Xylographa pallens]|nr:hypothetical protein [Xylographa pallens]